MKVDRHTKLKQFRFKDNFNINYEPYYIIENGVYKFLDKICMYKCMYKFGIMCQCERKKTKSELIYCYNNIEITERQKDYLRKRATTLLGTIPNNIGYIRNECGCKKKRQE